MGSIVSRIRKKKSTIETLEKLDHDIKEIEEIRTNAQRKYKKITELHLIYSIALCVLCGIIFYFQYNSILQGKLLYLVPLVISPFFVKVIISWYYGRIIKKNQITLNEMKKEKNRILEEVMEKETYKVAKQILEKYANDKPLKLNMNMQLAPVKQPDDGIRKRIVNVPNLPMASAPSKIYKDCNKMPTPRPIISTPNTSRALMAPVPSMVHLPAPILPLDRGYIDKVVEYLIGDGPNNRYALICSRCHSHNGMALKEEFEYIGFKCCYCFNYNPARKVRPEAPKLEIPMRLKQEFESDSDSKTSGENSDSEVKLQTEPGEKSVNDSNQLGVSNVDNVSFTSGDTMMTKECKGALGDEENNSSAITGAEDKEKETKLGSLIEAQNDSNQSEDANCD